MDVDVERPHVHHRKAGHWIDFAIPVSALFISLISIFIAWHHGEVMKQLVDQNAKLVRANSLPYLELGYSNGTPTGGVHWRFMATNSGVGPAKIQSVEIKVDGRPVSNPAELLTRCCDEKHGPRLLTSTLMGRMVRAGDTITYLDFAADSDTDKARKFAAAYDDERIVVTACYCSVFEECWTLSSKMTAPEPVEACPIPKRPYSY
ncbi:MAG: hypothetical protein ACJ8FC_02380 [Sphingomicrobium sp.]